MSKLQYSKVFRFLVCLVLVLSFLVNLSPLKAEATAVAGAVLSFEGLMSVLYSMGIGIVATELTVEAWNKIGNSLTEYITETGDSTITEVWIDLEAMYDSYIPGGGQDPDDELKWAEKLKHGLSRGLLAAIAGWLCSVVNMDGYEVEGEAVKTGWSYYGDFLLPTFPEIEGYPYQILVVQSTTTYCMRYSTEPFYSETSKPTCTWFLGTSPYYRYEASALIRNVENWNIDSSYNVTDQGSQSKSSYVANGTYLWSNFDILSYVDGSLVHAGSEPSTTKTEIIEPSIYVGDIPQQIKDGEKDKDTLILPPMDPFRVIQSPDTALDDLNQLQQQLQNGTMTVDQYVQQVQLQDPVTPDPPSTDPSIDPSDPIDPSVPDGPVSDIKPYGLDLKDYFPFCIPFDIYSFFSVLIAEPKAPVFHWELHDLSGNTYPIDVDLSAWDSFAATFRRMQLLLFIVGLAAASRKFIKW